MELTFNDEETKYNSVSLYNYLEFYRIRLILNNDLIRNLEFELYNYDTLYELEKENFIDEYENEIDELINEKIIEDKSDGIELDLEDMLEIKEEVTEEFINNHLDEIEENIYMTEVFQYFIIDERDIDYLNILRYPIYYNYENDLYLLGITHWGMGWDYVLTDINISNNTINTNQVWELLQKLRID